MKKYLYIPTLALITASLLGCTETIEIPDPTPSPDQTTKQPQTSSPITSGQTAAPIVTEPPLPKDTTPPIINGTDFEITVGDTVSYRNKVTISDDSDAAPTLSVDASGVDIDTVGRYPVVYTATDASGNVATLTLYLTIKAVVGANEGYVLQTAREILDEITDESMTKLQKAWSIYYWTRHNISYVSTSNKDSWVIGAYDAFRTRQGDCFSYYAAAKALLTAADIDVIDLQKIRTSEKSSRHYWLLVNVGDGWYHFDSTPFSLKNANFFMMTDDEIHAWDNTYYKGEHNYVADGLPKVGTTSIQHMVNYYSPTLKTEGN